MQANMVLERCNKLDVKSRVHSIWTKYSDHKLDSRWLGPDIELWGRVGVEAGIDVLLQIPQLERRAAEVGRRQVLLPE